MKTQITEFEAQGLLARVAKKSRAQEALASRTTWPMQSLISSIAVGTAVFATGRLNAPMEVKVLLSIGFVATISSQIAVWTLQRRLDAAIELLRQSEDQSSQRFGSMARTTTPSSNNTE